jgi:hypothetical protein
MGLLVIIRNSLALISRIESLWSGRSLIFRNYTLWAEGSTRQSRTRATMQSLRGTSALGCRCQPAWHDWVLIVGVELQDFHPNERLWHRRGFDLFLAE